MTAVPITEPLPSITDTAAYFKELARRQREHDAGEAWRLVPYPAPGITSRDGVLPDAPAPAAQLQALAEAAGWTVVRQFSHGCMPHATTGKPGPAREMHALLMARPDGRRAVACYRRQSAGWKWESMWTWSITTRHTPHATVSAFREALIPSS